MRITRAFAVTNLCAAMVIVPAPVWADTDDALAAAGEASSEPVLKDARQRRPWDAARMTELTAQLATAMRELRQAFRREPNVRDQNSPNRRATQNMEETLRTLERSTAQLARQVADGAGFEKTQAVVRRIGTSLNDADMWSRRIKTTASMANAARPAMTLFNEVAPYYGLEPPFDLTRLERVDRAPNPDRSPPSQAVEAK
jgi:hypothetical protein